MTSSSTSPPTPWTLARRTSRMTSSVIREFLKLAEQPGMRSMAGGLPSPDSFPVAEMRAACDRVLADAGREALQYATSEGHAPLRAWVAEHLQREGLHVSPDQVLITTGSQQGLDLVAKVLVDAGAPIAVESPTYLGALQAFAPFEPQVHSVAGDADGPLPKALLALCERQPKPRFLYALPNFQNPSGRLMPLARRQALVAAARQAGVPLVEDNPYGELWYDAPPPPALASLWPEGTVYLGSFSKVLAPGLRLGYVVAPPALYGRLVQAKQAADLHTPTFNQRVVHEVIRHGFLDTHVPAIRARYCAQRDAMQAALQAHLPPGCEWMAPRGGMFFWVRLPVGCDALALLPQAVQAGIAYVPGEAFYAHEPDPRTLRLSFVTLGIDDIRVAVAALGQVLRHHLDARGPCTAAA